MRNIAIFLFVFFAVVARGAYLEETFVAEADGSVQKYLICVNGITNGADVVFCLHGHGSDRSQVLQTRGEFSSVRDVAEDRGMIVVSPDYRAKTSWMGPAAEADTVQLVRTMKARFGGRVFFIGASMGATSALTFTARHPDLVDGVVALNPLADHLSYGNFQDAIAASFGGTKAEKPDEYRARSALYFPERFTMPVSITLGGKDTTVPPESARRLAAEIAKRRPENLCLDDSPSRGHETDYAASVKAIREMLRRADARRPAQKGDWPFAMLRCYGGYVGNERFLSRVFAAQERHPDLINEIWFCGYGDDPFCSPAEAGANAAKLCNGARKRCDELGIRFSYQQGITLNHTPDGVRRPNVPDDAWVVDRDGKRHYGVLCCTSPFARDYTREKAKAIMAALRPDSYWPDDDLRLEKIEGDRPKLCFCDRCVRLFGKQCGRDYDRASLVADLIGPNAKSEVRREWALFGSRSLAEYARVFREAADAVDPSMRLGVQVCNGGNRYTYQSSRWFLRAVVGKDVGAGLRLGPGYYQDKAPRDLFLKLHGCVLRDTSRLGGFPDVAQVCYEAENWPHVGAYKNPSGMMAECALALCYGCDSLAFYWGADQNGEDDASYDHWLDTLAAWKPFLLTVRDRTRGTVQGGVAYHLGSGVFALDDWMRYDHYGRDTEKVAQNGLPMTVDEAAPDALYLDERSARSLSDQDLQGVFSRPVVVTPGTFADLQQRFKQAAFLKKLDVMGLGAEVAWATEIRASGYEVFPSGLKSEGVSHFLYPKSADVVPLSRMTADKSAAGACLVPTEFGGTVAVVQDFDCVKHEGGWPGCRRHATLDALDRIVPGKMPARLLTDGYATWVVVRKAADGRTAAVCVMNIGTGETPPLEVAIRRGVCADWKLHLPKTSAIAAEKVRESADETVIRLPSLPAFGLVFIAP